MTYSYLGEVVLPLTVTPPRDLGALPVQAKASWLICEKICVPEEGELRARAAGRDRLRFAAGRAVRRRR